MYHQTVDKNLNQHRPEDGPDQARPKDPCIEHVKFQVHHRPQDQESQLGCGGQGDKGGGEEGVGFAAQAKDDGQEHHQQDGEDNVLFGQLGHFFLGGPDPDERGQQGADDQEGRDVHKVDQGRFRDVGQPFVPRRLASRGVLLLGAHGGLRQWGEEGGTVLAGLPVHDQTGDHGHDVAQADPQSGHPQAAHRVKLQVLDAVRFLTGKGSEGAEDDDEVDDRAGQQVGDAAAERQALAEQPPHHGDDAALAHGKEQTQQAPGGDGEEPAARQDPGHQRGGQKLLQDAGDDGPQNDEGHRLPENPREPQDEILSLQEIFVVHLRRLLRVGGQLSS